MREFMSIPKGFMGLPMEEVFLTPAENKKKLHGGSARLELRP